MQDVLEQKQTSELTIIANKIDTGLAAFEQRKSELIELEKEAHGLKIESIEDKESINQVSVIRKKLKVARVDIEKEGKSMRDPLTQISKVISAKEKELIAIIEPTEKELLAQEKWVESEKERIRQEEIAKENERVELRINALGQYGYKIDYADIKSMSDETFDAYLNAAKAQFEKEQEERAEIERQRLAQEENDRIAREAEQNRLAAERKELEELRAKQAEAQRIIDEQNAAIEAEKKNIANEKEAIELARQKEIEQRNRAEELRIAKEKAAEEARENAIREAKALEEARIAAENKAKELAKRKAERAPDKEKIQEYIKLVKSVPVPEMKTADGCAVMATIQELISRFDAYATEKAETL